MWYGRIDQRLANVKKKTKVKGMTHVIGLLYSILNVIP